jgi:hypothetical protein
MKNLNNEEIIDYLMTSDFNESLSPEELKNLLLKFRYFYRINLSRSNSIEMEKKRFDYEIEELKLKKQEEINNLSDSNSKLLSIYNSITSRKLTFKERLFGKIKPKSNEKI